MIKKLLLGVLAGTLVLGMTAFASDENVDAKGQTVTALDSAYLVKYLEMAEGVTKPDGVSFTFTFTSDDADHDPTGVPAPNPITFQIGNTSANQNQTDKPYSEGDSNSQADGASLIMSMPLSEIFDATKFTHAGVYTYEVTETATTTTEGEAFTTEDGKSTRVTEDDTTGIITTETITNSTEKYKVNIIVKNGDDGNPVVQGATIAKVAEDDTEEKVVPVEDPTTDDGTEDGNDQTDGGQGDEIPGFSFTNVYEKKIKKPISPNPDDPTAEEGKYGAMGITKTVVGEYGDQTFDFPFEITMTAGAGNRETSATGYLYTGEGADAEKGNAVTVEFGAADATTFTLHHGQALIFEELPAGVSYEVTELLSTATTLKDQDKYTATSAVTTTNEQAADLTEAKAIDDTKTKENDTYVKNTIDDTDITPMGIVINNLPYILLVAIAALGFIFMAARKRREF